MALQPVAPEILKACAGAGVTIPALGSTVSYFPQGHAEQASSPPDLSSIPIPKQPYIIPCILVSTSFFVDPDTDEVVVKMLLHPLASDCNPPEIPPPSPDEPGEVRVVSKVLTASDANNGGGFTAPKSFAESIYPPLDFTVENPCQDLLIHDLKGEEWKFRHIHRGKPRRHLLTTGWSKFVNAKRLIAGDTIVFIKNQAGEIFVGIRRANVPPMTPRPTPTPMEGGFSRNVNGRISPESVVEAIKEAEMKHPFEVVYYPMAGLPEFVVEANTVKRATVKSWSCGMRVKMSSEMLGSSKTPWLQGTVSAVTLSSPWRMLQVIMDDDDDDGSQKTKNVNPWQVEELASTSTPPSKKSRTSSNSVSTPSTPTHSSMQGARHYSTSEIGSSSNSVSRADNNNGNDQKLIEASEEPSSRIGDHTPTPSSSQSQGSSTGRNTSGGSIMLFGQTIQCQPPIDDATADRVAEDDPLVRPFFKFL